MSIELRVVLVVVSILTLVFITKRVRSAKVELDDSIFWFCFAGLLLVVSLFPQIFYFLSEIAGTKAPVNFVFLFFIFILLILGFSLNMRISQMSTKLKELTQLLAIEKFERYNNDREESLHASDRAVAEEVWEGGVHDAAADTSTERGAAGRAPRSGE